MEPLPPWSRLLSVALLAALAAALVGCYDTRQVITLNPDGSGKAQVESVFLPPDWWNDAPSRPQPAAQAALRRILQTAEGVDAWQDVSSDELPDGRIRIRGTAYFPDLSRFKTELTSLQRFSVTRDGGGRLTLAIRTSPPAGVPGWVATNRLTTPETLARERQKLKLLRPLLAGLLESSAMDSTVQLPGTIQSSANFERAGPDQVRLRLSGPRLIAALDRFIADPEFAPRRLNVAGAGDPQGQDAANELLYGERAPVHAVTETALKPRFNYTAEVAQASIAFPAVAKSLGLPVGGNPILAPASDPAGPAQLAVTGVEWRFNEAEPDHTLPIRARTGYTLRLKARLAEPILAARSIEITQATTAEGRQLAASPGAIQLSSPPGGDGATQLRFAVSMESPPPDSRGLSTLEGFIHGECPLNRRADELFAGPLRGTAAGLAPGTQLEFVPESPAGTGKIVLHSSLPPEHLLWLQVRTDAGRLLEARRQGTITVGERHAITFALPHPLPASGRVVAGRHDGRTTVRIPFALTNVNLLGQPVAAN